MAKAGVIAALTVGLGAVALLAVSEAFVPTAARHVAHQGRFLGASSTPSGGLGSSASYGAATVAMSMVATIVAGRLLATREQQRRAAAPVVVCQAAVTGEAAAAPAAEEAPFAGGLIGGQSAFSSGDYNFDPLNLAGKFPEWLPWFREAELKHGRVAMLAWVGLVVPEIVRIPGPERCYGAPNAVEAHMRCVGSADDPTSPLLQVFLFCFVIELCTTAPKGRQGFTLENAGDYRLGLNFLPKDPAKAEEMKLKEMKNGRLAMVAFGGAITQAVLTGNTFPWLY